jgi:hypothetical protein
MHSAPSLQILFVIVNLYFHRLPFKVLHDQLNFGEMEEDLHIHKVEDPLCDEVAIKY